MILYFSATENCKYVATRLAQDGGQEMRSIVDCMRDGRYAFEGESIGIVSPTYFWGLPVVVREFLERLRSRRDTCISSRPTEPRPARPARWPKEPYGGAESTRLIPCACRTHGRRCSIFPHRRRWRGSQGRPRRTSTACFAVSAGATPTGI